MFTKLKNHPTYRTKYGRQKHHTQNDLLCRYFGSNWYLIEKGCYVPAESLEMTLVDRVFTRLGASDRLQDGKSTFYIEMEETLNIVRDGTRHSLAILDELGRGTSTYDGVAIAYAVLKYLHDKIQYLI